MGQLRRPEREPDSAEQSSRATQYSLPQLPVKAKPRLDHQGFREQGNKAADERAKKLRTKISSLGESEERLREEQEKLWSSASKDLSDAARALKDTKDLVDQVHDDDLIDLCKAVAGQSQETQSALKRVLGSLGGVTSGLKKDVIKRPGFLEGTEASNFTAERSTISEAVMSKIRLSTRAKRRTAVLRKKQLEKDLDLLEARLRQPSGYSGIDSSDLLLETDDEDMDVSDNQSEDIQGRSLSKDQVPEVSGRKRTWDANGEGNQGDWQSKKIKGDGLAGNVGLDVKTREEREQKEPQSNNDERKERLEKIGQEGELSKKGADGWELLARETLQGKIQEKKAEIVIQKDKIMRLDENYKKLEKPINGIERELVEDQHREQSYREKRREKDSKEFKDLRDQEKRGKELQKLRREIFKKRYLPSDNQMRQQGYDQISRMERMMARRLRNDFLTYQYDISPSHFVDGYDSEDDATDNQLDETDETDKTVQEHSLGLLEKLVTDAQLLEAHIQRMQDHYDKLEHVTNLKHVLDIERKLEIKWLSNPRGSNSIRLDDTTTTHLNDNHFSARDISEGEIYESLKEDEFRVLVLVPAPEPYYPLICKLETWSMKDMESPENEKKYAALSYFWGREEVYNGRIYLLPHHDVLSDPSEWGTATRSATPVHVRNSLFRALLRLRRNGNDSQPVALWVDFMCIDQKNDYEKTKQLNKMVQIYRNASNVCIWLGEGDDDGRSDEAMQFIRTTMDFAVLDRLAHDKSQAKKWYALGELMRDRWFSRRWVVQEIALAKEATVHCGQRRVQWSDFADAASLLVSNQEIIKSLFDFSEWREGRNTLGDVGSFGASILLEAINNLFRRKPNGDIKKPIKTIESLVTSLKTFDTGNRRDLIYSLVGIARDTSYAMWDSVSDDASHKKFEVNYGKSEVAVYNDFTDFCVSSSGSLDIICRPWAMPLRGGDALPSWIPLLSNSEFGVPEEIYSGRKNGEILVGPAGSPNYEASGKTKFDGTFKSQKAAEYTSRTNGKGDDTNSLSIDTGRILVAKGFRLAKIKEVSPRNTGGVIVRESLEMGGWQGFKRDTDSVPDPIWRTLVADRDQYGRVPPSWYQRACLRCLEMADTFNNGDLNVGELLQGHSDMLRKYLTRVRNVTWNRRFFTAIDQEKGAEDISKDNQVIVSSEENKEEKEEEERREEEKEKGEEKEEDKEQKKEQRKKKNKKKNKKNTDKNRKQEEEPMDDELHGQGKEEEEASKEKEQNRLEEGMVCGRSGDETGILFGLCPPETQVEDIICVLYGCTVPVVLREMSDGYMKLVGEAYVHGKMDGEAMDDPGATEYFRIQ
ncbi:heterokaryon incompatibility protein-domain-containing protein [Annulohypoxylon truncatum]|uniref:heterokaryon incompatibility protein-domain-containing protein n=1 Tax=Annulohypoxylon truncatum TaxID=327061 RepID=UPI0020079457|nr:heterokaryon incompatibility protein-domain-containing protein [Annulohypoxylon truncatum]KAI1212937.1 heterokaryon incompatibility protein-domain-containing protein [Annulohypoxylon truncatum]